MKENEKKKRAHELTGALLRVMEKPKDVFATVKTLLKWSCFDKKHFMRGKETIYSCLAP